MPFKPDSFARMESRVEKTLRNETPLLDVPYYICLHNPKDEALVIEEFTNMAHRVNKKGFTSEVLRLSDIMIESLEERGLLEDEILDKEEEIRSDLESDLHRVLLEDISRKLLNHLTGKDYSHCVILLRYGSLLPFVHLSGILQSIDGSIRCTLVIPYPTTIREGYPLDMKIKGHIGYYRAEVVDLR